MQPLLKTYGAWDDGSVFILCFRSVMSLWCGRRWRKVRRPNRNLATAQEGSPRTKITVNIQHDSKCNNCHQNSLLALHLLSQLPFWPLSVSRSAFCSPLAKRRSLSQWEIDLVRRLQTPTVSYLARSKSAVCLSRDTGITLEWGIQKSQGNHKFGAGCNKYRLPVFFFSSCSLLKPISPSSFILNSPNLKKKTPYIFSCSYLSSFSLMS